ncbi:MAG: hypothetical protein JO117_10920 [Verrucomicrobia bacterium]|nr:hypothetical protein [Verrucomicrobiota bacterium]MBV9656508.1 hypothetical protein [Verrucomicrobiota bacterium]
MKTPGARPRCALAVVIATTAAIALCLSPVSGFAQQQGNSQPPRVAANNAAAAGSNNNNSAALASVGQPPGVGNAPLPNSIPDTIAPTWETQVDARTCYFEIPAPRGQIVDRNGLPLAQSRLGYHLDLSFPNQGKELSDSEVFAYVKTHLVTAQTLLRRPLELKTDDVLDHYHNRRILPMDLATYLPPEEVERLRGSLQPPLSLKPVYLRTYPNGVTAGAVVGYVGKIGGTPHGPPQPNEPLWTGFEGREGLEKTFNDQLTGHNGSLNLTFDGNGRKTSERILSPPVPGKNVVTTLDLPLQKLCEDTLARNAKRGAIVMLDPRNGDVLALASWPSFDPNAFVPSISDADFRRLNDDKSNPLIPRAFRSSYPAGSTFKVIVGAAALQSRTIDAEDTFPGPASMTIGSVVMHNWKKTDAGDLNFVEALTQSCNTWFYQVGIKTGGDRLVDWGKRFGFGKRTGLPLRDEDHGRLPDNAYMKRVHKRRLLDGDVANLAIGQGDLLVTPVQMAQAMGTIGNGGTFYQTRLVQQVQTPDGEVVGGYPIQPRAQMGLTSDVLGTLRKAMVNVVSGAGGTAHRASVPGVEVAGKTGTAQWGGNGNRQRQRTAAWFVGFAPAKQPKYAFAALYEGEPGDNSIHGGTSAAPLIGKVLREVLKKDASASSKNRKKQNADDDEDKPAKRRSNDDDDGDNSD